MICRYAGVCGGCSLLHLSYSQQLAEKEASLRRLLGQLVPSRSGGLFIPVPDIEDPPTRFRQKVAFVFGPAAGGRSLTMGHYQRGSRRIVHVEQCPVHSDRGNRIALALRDRLADAGLKAAGSDPSGLLRHVIVRTTADDREAVAMLVVARNDKSLRKPVRAFLDASDASERPDGFFINVNTDPGPFMVGDQTIRIHGRSSVREVVGGFSYLISPDAFFQTNARAAGVLQNHVIRSVHGATHVLDLYCGSGLFSLPLAASGAKVIGVEENRQAVEDARTNATLNRIAGNRVRFIAARTESALRTVGRDPWDAVILDPPRQGCSDSVLEEVFQNIVPPRVTYVSCNPEALAAELPGIVQCGYRVKDLRAIDMFPHTDHVEAIVQLERCEV